MFEGRQHSSSAVPQARGGHGSRRKLWLPSGACITAVSMDHGHSGYRDLPSMHGPVATTRGSCQVCRTPMVKKTGINLIWSRGNPSEALMQSQWQG